MSNPRRLWAALWIATLGVAIATEARADNPMETWARWVAAQRGTWKGQTVPFPAIEERPSERGWIRCSWSRPICVHGLADADDAAVLSWLDAAEWAYDVIGLGGWPRAFPDGGRGGTQQHDLYLVDAPPRAPLGHLDAPMMDGNLDGAITFATLPRSVTPDRQQACAVSALIEAALYGRDPAEAPAWRRATGAFVAWVATGHAGCDEQAISEQQRQPHRGWITDATDSGAGAAMMLAMLSDRTDGGSGTFLRELWQLGRQLTWEGQRLRGSPDLWEATIAAVENAHETLPQLIEDFAVARYFARPGLTPPYPSLRELPSDAVVPVEGPVIATQLPAHLHLGEPPLEVFGSAYVMVDAAGIDPMGRVKVWLRGELGVEWSLIAVRLRADGTEAGRVIAPPRRDPRSFFPVELLGETARVLLVVTNLGKGNPDADIEAMRAHAFSLIVDIDR